MLKVNNKIIKVNNKWLNAEPYPPIVGNTFRIMFSDSSYDPRTDTPDSESFTATQVSSNPNIWDITQTAQWPTWESVFSSNTYDGYNFNSLNGTFDVIGYGNELYLGSCYDTFKGSKLRSCCYFPLNTLYDQFFVIGETFEDCIYLTELPDLNYSEATDAHGHREPLNEYDIDRIYYGCINVESGILREYNKLSILFPHYSQPGHPFYNCGSNTTTGAAELAQIPDNWK